MKVYSAVLLFNKPNIKEYEAEKADNEYVWVVYEQFGDGHYVSKRTRVSEYECFFDTFDKAKEWLIKCLTHRVDDLKTKLSREETNLEHLKNLKHEDVQSK